VILADGTPKKCESAFDHVTPTTHFGETDPAFDFSGPLRLAQPSAGRLNRRFGPRGDDPNARPPACPRSSQAAEGHGEVVSSLRSGRWQICRTKNRCSCVHCFSAVTLDSRLLRGEPVFDDDRSGPPTSRRLRRPGCGAKWPLSLPTALRRSGRFRAGTSCAIRGHSRKLGV